MSLAALTGEEVNTFRLEVARRMRTEQWNDSIPWSSEAAKKVIMVRSYLIYAINEYRVMTKLNRPRRPRLAGPT